MKKVYKLEDWRSIECKDDEIKDLSLDSFFERCRNLFSITPTPLNLGIYQTQDNVENKKQGTYLHATKYVGVMPLIPLSLDGVTEKTLKEMGESDIWVVVNSRFNIRPHQMLCAILSGNDFYNVTDTSKILSFRYCTCEELRNWNENEKVLFGRLKNAGKIDLKGNGNDNERMFILAEEYGVFEIIDFILKAKDVCKRKLKTQAQRVEENLNGKIKGRILLQKQVKYNICRGQYQKVYCAYNSMSEDIRENEILKYALYLCEHCSNGIVDCMNEDMMFCKRVMMDIPLKKCGRHSFMGLKSNGAYHYYKDALEAARRIIERYGIEDDKNGEVKAEIRNYQVEPFFIDMNYLFELYCRAVLRKAVENINNKYKLTDGIYFKLESRDHAKRILTDSKFFMNEYIPDMVLTYSEREETDAEKKSVEEKVAAVFDAKYSDITDSRYKREKTHQLLFYMNVLHCSVGGLIGPTSASGNEKVELKGIWYNCHSGIKHDKYEDNFEEYVCGILLKNLDIKCSWRDALDKHSSYVGEYLTQIRELYTKKSNL